MRREGGEGNERGEGEGRAREKCEAWHPQGRKAGSPPLTMTMVKKKKKKKIFILTANWGPVQLASNEQELNKRRQ